MNVLNPLALWGLILLSIPIILHFINFRKPDTLAFSSISFLEELQQTVVKRFKLKQLLLLLVRLAALSALILAFARPFWASQQGLLEDNNQNPSILVIDTSPSMTQVDAQGPYRAQAIEAAQALIDADKDQEWIILPSHGPLSYSGPIRGAMARAQLEEIEWGLYGQRWMNHLETLQSENPISLSTLYWISDGQQTELEESLVKINKHSFSFEKVMFIRVGESSASNTAITEIKLASGLLRLGSSLPLVVKVQNYGKDTLENQFVRLEMEDEIFGEQNIDLYPGEAQSLQFQLPQSNSGFVPFSLHIQGDGVEFDNTFYGSMFIPKEKKIVVLAEKDLSEERSYFAAVRKALEEVQEEIVIEVVTPQEFDSFNLEVQTLMLYGLTTIPEYMLEPARKLLDAGKTVIVIPGSDANMQSYNSFLSGLNAGSFSEVKGELGTFTSIARLDRFEQQHPIFQSMFEIEEGEQIKMEWPNVFYYWKYISGNSFARPIMAMDNGDAFITESKIQNGTLMISSAWFSPLWTSLPTEPIFAPFFYQWLMYSSSSEAVSLHQYDLNNPLSLYLPWQTGSVTLQTEQAQLIPEIDRRGKDVLISYHANDWQPGWVTVMDDKSNVTWTIAENLPTSESQIVTLSEVELETRLKETFEDVVLLDNAGLTSRSQQEVITSAQFGVEWWTVLVFLAIVLLIIENVISSFLKTERF